jgi:hypothetical protein
VPRPSSPLGTKASTRCPSCAAPAPSPKHARSEIRWQRTDDRPSPADLRWRNPGHAPTAAPADARRIGRTHTHAPGPTSSRRVMAGPASRSRLASRCQQNTGQKTDDGPPRSIIPASVTTRGSDARRRCPGLAALPSVLCRLHLVGLGRVERPTSRLSGVRSDQLSYRPKVRDQRTDDRRQTRRSGVSRAADVGSVLCSLISVI